MANILIIANTASPLERRRGLIPHYYGYNLIWYAKSHNDISSFKDITKVRACTDWFQNSILKRLMILFEPMYIWLIIKNYSIDLIYVQWADQKLKPYGFAKNIPVVLSVMGSDIMPHKFLDKKRNFRYVKYMLKRADIITSKSSHMDRIIIEINANYLIKIRRITWGVDLEKFSRVNDDKSDLLDYYKLDSSSKILFDMRSAQPLYQKEIILNAISLIPNESNIVLLISEFNGLESYLNYLKRLTKDLNIEHRVRFIGDIQFNRMPDIYNISDFGISMSKSDGLPQSLFEMMASSTYPILSELEQYQELVNYGLQATFISLENKKEMAVKLANKIIYLIENQETIDEAISINKKIVSEIADEKKQFKKFNDILLEKL